MTIEIDSKEMQGMFKERVFYFMRLGLYVRWPPSGLFKQSDMSQK